MMALPFSGHGVTLGGLRLVDWGQPVTYDDGYTFEISADGTTWGNPQVVVSSLISELSDGDIVQQQRAGNREPVLYVRISATDHHALVAGDTALGAVVGGPCELVWQPPDSDAPPTVIDVVHSRMDHQWDDMDALKFQRVWVVTMSALPWPRSADLVVTPALAPSSTTVVNSGSATMGWTSTNGAVSVVSGAVVSTYPGGTLLGGETLHGGNLSLTGVVDTSTAKYVAVDWKSSVAVYHAFKVNNGFNLAEQRREPAPTAGFTRSWYRVSEPSVSKMRFGTVHAPVAASATLSIDQIVQADSLPISGSARQLTRAVSPGGSVPAEGSVIVENTTSELEQVIIYSHPAGGGYSPPLRPWLYYSDTVTTSADLVSGAFHGLAGSCGFKVPVSALPEGDVQLWARVRASVAGAHQVLWTASAYMNDAVVGDIQEGGTLVTFPAIGQWILAPLGRLTLPTSPIGPAGFHRITLQQAPGTVGDVQVDEAWLFAMDRGKLTAIDFPLGGTGANRIKVSAPSLTLPNGRIAAAYIADWSDAYTPSGSAVLCDQTGHKFDPAGSVIFTVTSGVPDALVSLEHYPRWRAEAS